MNLEVVLIQMTKMTATRRQEDEALRITLVLLMEHDSCKSLTVLRIKNSDNQVTVETI